MSHVLTHAAIHIPKIPRRYAPTVFALLMSSGMSGLMSATLTLVNTGYDAGFAARWTNAWAVAFALAFPLVTLLAPRVRKVVDRITG